MRQDALRRWLGICLLLSACAATPRPPTIEGGHRLRADRRVSRRVAADDGVRLCLLMETMSDPEVRSLHLRLHVSADRQVGVAVAARPYLTGCVARALEVGRLPLLPNGASDDYDVLVSLRTPRRARPAARVPAHDTNVASLK